MADMPAAPRTPLLRVVPADVLLIVLAHTLVTSAKHTTAAEEANLRVCLCVFPCVCVSQVHC